MPGVEALHALRDSIGCHRQGTTADRPRRSQSAVAVPVRHRDRPQRAREESIQRTCRHALVHGLSPRHDRRLPRLAHAGDRHCRRPVRRSGADGAPIAAATFTTHSRACAASPLTRTRSIGRSSNPDDAAAHEALQLGDQLWHGRAVTGARARSSPADRQRDHRATPARHIRDSGSGARTWSQNAMLDRRIESVFGWPLHITTSPNKRTLYNFPMQVRRRRNVAAGGVAACAKPASCPSC